MMPLKRLGGLLSAAALAPLLGLTATVTAAGAAPAPAAAPGLHIEDGRVVEANGADFVMRGVNHMHTWYRHQLGALDDIKALGANTVRVVLASGDRWERNDTADVAEVVARCKAARLICVLEVHDTTGYGEDAAAATLAQAAEYWISVQDALAGEEDYIVVNIGNEPYGNVGYEGWAADTAAAIATLRDAGFGHLLMVDAPAWGQDWDGTMRDAAPDVLAADPDANTLFSVHMYNVYDTPAKVSDYLRSYTDAGIPVAVGEFGHNSGYGDPDEDAIMRTSQELGTGYLGWAWSGNATENAYLDLVTDFDPGQLTDWGERLFHGADGIAATSREATVYGDAEPDTEPPTAPGTPAVSAVTDTSVSLAWAAATDDTAVTGYRVVAVDGATETEVAASTAPEVSVTGLSAATEYTFAAYALDAAGNRSARSGTVTVRTEEPGPAGSCAVGYRVVGSWNGGFQGEVVLENTGEAAWDGWNLGWDFPAGQQVTQMWGGTAAQSGAAVSVTPASYTAQVPPGGSVTIGFLGSWQDGNPEPEAFTLDGGTCAVS